MSLCLQKINKIKIKGAKCTLMLIGPLVGEQMHKTCLIHTVFYSALKMRKMLTLAAKRIKPEDTLLSEIRQTQANPASLDSHWSPEQPHFKSRHTVERGCRGWGRATGS